MRFKYYVLNCDRNTKEIIPFNIFRNIHVQERTEREIKKYLRSPKNYKYTCTDGKVLYGFEALCKEIDSTIAWQEAHRCEYEMGVCYKFETDISNVKHMDCYMQAHMNISAIARECIFQYKQYMKGLDNE